MANTPQAKKRIRRNANRADINHSRISRIRTFIKQVESALASGKKAEAAEALKSNLLKLAYTKPQSPLQGLKPDEVHFINGRGPSLRLNDQFSVRTRGVGPAESTGKSLSRSAGPRNTPKPGSAAVAPCAA